MENSPPPNPGPNGFPGQSTDGTGAGDARQQAMQRAEEMADRWAEQIGQFASSVGHGILKWAARAREEAEDIWAEAQALRQGQKLVDMPPEQAPPEQAESIWAEAQALRRRSANNQSENAPPENR